MVDFLMDGNSMQRYYSSTQAEMGNGLMMHWYIQLFDVIGSYYTERAPTLTFEEILN